MFNRLRFQKRWRIGLCGGCKTGYTCVRLQHPTTPPPGTTSWSSSPLWHVRYSGDNVKTLHKLSNFSWCMWGCIIVRLRLNDCWNRQFRCAVHLFSCTEVVGSILPFPWCRLVKLHLLLLNSLHALQHCFGDYAHHPAWLVIFAHLALLCLFRILIFPILPIGETSDLAKRLSNSNHPLMKSYFRLCCHQCRVFSYLSIFLLLPHRCLCIFNSLSCPSGFSLNIIRIPFLCLFIA